ncbi:MAG: AAA family ATPase, partial [Thermodesulfovibrionales bacterium]|nr:AAA family ATPase [Thermodesulfovibrionales bacterium]
KVNSLDLLKLIIHDFGVTESGRTHKDLMDDLNNFLLGCFDRNEKAVLIIDEAQEMSTECLEFIRLLSNLETDTRKLLQVILIGQPELAKIIKSERLKQLDQRIAVRYHLEPLPQEDTAKYIRHRLEVAGRIIKFPTGTVKAVYKASRGIPRLINLYCDRALMLAYAEGQPYISGRIMKAALKEMEARNEPFFFSLRFAGLLLLSMAALAFLGVMLNSGLRKATFDSAALTALQSQNNTSGLENSVPVSAGNAVTGKADEDTAAVFLLDETWRAKDYKFAEQACVLNLLAILGEKDLNAQDIGGRVRQRGYSQYEFKEIEKIKKFKLPAILTIEENNIAKHVVLRWLVLDNALVIDPVEGKKILPFGEVNKLIKNIKVLYKNRYTNHVMQIDARSHEKAIMLSKENGMPKLTP